MNLSISSQLHVRPCEQSPNAMLVGAEICDYSPSTRVAKPPGGDCSDIFGDAPIAPTTPSRTPHKLSQSNVFADEAKPVNPRGINPTSSPRHVNTTSRLFGEGRGVSPARKVNAKTWTSRVFDDEAQNGAPPRSPKKTPKKNFERNPITGETVYTVEADVSPTSAVGPMAALPQKTNGVC